MGRILKILVYAVILFFVYLWISTMIKSCGNSESKNTDHFEEDAEQTDDLTPESGEGIYDEIDTTSFNSNTPAEDAIDYTEIDNTLNNVEEETTFTPARATNTQGRYMVIAGSYLLKSNAKNMISKLEKLGYGNSEIVVFDLSQYHSVSAGRYKEYSDAQALANELKSRGIDCYVHSKK